MKKLRFHVVALPHTQTRPCHEACAYTMKVLRFCEMMKSLGHIVFHYGAEGSEADCDEHIQIISRSEQIRYFGEWDKNALYNLGWTGSESYWPLTNGRAAAEINARKQKRDILALITGTLTIPLVKAVGEDKVLPVEYGIGYTGTFSQYRCFESYSHQHMVWGYQGGRDPNGRFYDAVIPNYYPETAFPYQAQKGDYYLYLGRIMRRKGVDIAVQTCKRIGAKLILAGQGVEKVEGNKIHCVGGEVFAGDHLEYVGCVTGARKVDLLGKAKAVFTPTYYVEPFGGVAVEAQMTGTPVISTDFGAFTETVEHGKTGFRCHTLQQFIWAAQHIHELDPWYIHQRAVANYSMERVKWMYQEYFEMLDDLWDQGWDQENGDRCNLDWLTRY